MDTSLRPLFFNLAQECAQDSGAQVKRTHIYQLVAACFGYGSWESFRMQCVLIDRVGSIPSPQLAQLVGRALQLGLERGRQSEAVVQALMTAVRTRDLRAMKMHELSALMLRHGKWPVDGHWEFSVRDEDDLGLETDFDDVDEDKDEEFDWLTALRASPVLHAALSERAAKGDADCQLWLAALLRCRRPNSYLHDEEQRGRRLNSTEQTMRDEYLRDAPKFAFYGQHLRAAAKSGIAVAAIECALVFGEEQWLENADFEDNPELLLAAAESVRDETRATNYLLRGSELGSQLALEHLARQGHPAGIEHMATQGDRASLVLMATHALDGGRVEQAWIWQAVAEEYGLNLQDGSARAYHSEGQHAGEDYDDDVGGPLHVLELETVALPVISPEGLQHARQKAVEIVEAARISDGYKDYDTRITAGEQRSSDWS